MQIKTYGIILVILVSLEAIAQQSRTFELRYFSNDPEANGESDFKGSTSVFSTDQRVDFLKHYAGFAADFFNTPGFDHEVVSDSEAAEVALKIKPQPEPQYRNRINLDEWSWLGYRQGQETESLVKLHKYGINNSVTLLSIPDIRTSASRCMPIMKECGKCLMNFMPPNQICSSTVPLKPWAGYR